MRERGAFLFIALVGLFSVWLFSGNPDELDTQATLPIEQSAPSVMINGQLYAPKLDTHNGNGRMIIRIDRDELYAGENTVEVRWGQAPATATLASEKGEVTLIR